jgi:hypothetical protein
MTTLQLPELRFEHSRQRPVLDGTHPEVTESFLKIGAMNDDRYFTSNPLLRLDRVFKLDVGDGKDVPICICDGVELGLDAEDELTKAILTVVDTTKGVVGHTVKPLIVINDSHVRYSQGADGPKIDRAYAFSEDGVISISKKVIDEALHSGDLSWLGRVLTHELGHLVESDIEDSGQSDASLFELIEGTLFTRHGKHVGNQPVRMLGIFDVNNLPRVAHTPPLANAKEQEIYSAYWFNKYEIFPVLFAYYCCERSGLSQQAIDFMDGQIEYLRQLRRPYSEAS